MSENRYLSPREAAQYARMGYSTLNKMRTHGGGPPFVRPSRRVLYATKDLDAWLEARKQRSTSEYAPA